MSLFKTLKPKPKAADGSSTCLLLDISGSMDEHVATTEDGISPRRIEVLFKAVRDTPECSGLKAFAFASSCHPLEVIPDEEGALNYIPTGGTNLAGAFTTVKAAGYYNAILITDGQPDNELSALNAALGMRLGIIYIGDPPTPSFLERLAASTEGTFQLADLRSVQQLEDAIMKALPPPEATTTDPKGPISL